jgi:hypothetical protein
MIKPILIIIMILSIFNVIAISDTQQTVYAEKDVDEQTQQEDAYCDDADDESRQETCEALSKGQIQDWHDDEKASSKINVDAEELKVLIDEKQEELEEENKELDKGVEVSEEPEQEEEFETNNEEVEEEQEEESEPEEEEGEE